jgi:ABC-2 type transport system permease protein
MNIPSNAMSQSTFESQTSQVEAPVGFSATRRFYWSVRRELWEYRLLFIAPLAIAALFLFAFLISSVQLPGKMRTLSALDSIKQQEAIRQPYNFAELALMATFLVVAVFYCLDALHGERRDRSILFWKSLPVSDLITVLAKASIPVLVLPLFTFAITVVTQFIMLLWSTGVLTGSGTGVAMLWSHVPLFRMSLGLFEHLVAFHGFWYAPFYCWLLLVSAWARRAPFLWAILPPLAVGIVERITFGTSYFGAKLLYRFAGAPENIASASARQPMDRSMDMLEHFTVGHFLLSPGLWIGFAIAAAFLAAAVRLRRHRDPI